MDIEYVESLVRKSKNNDKEATEKIIKEFTPLIINISKRTFINGYDFLDIQNECILSLLKAIDLYNIEKNTFVYYATSSIKNNINYLIKKTIKNKYEPIDTLDNIKLEYNKDIDYNLLQKEESTLINNCVKSLSKEEYDLFTHLYINNKGITEYAYINNMLYQTIYNRKKKLLNKIYNYIK